MTDLIAQPAERPLSTPDVRAEELHAWAEQTASVLPRGLRGVAVNALAAAKGTGLSYAVLAAGVRVYRALIGSSVQMTVSGPEAPPTADDLGVLCARSMEIVTEINQAARELSGDGHLEVARAVGAQKLFDLAHAISAAPTGGEENLLAWREHVLDVADGLVPVVLAEEAL